MILNSILAALLLFSTIAKAQLACSGSLNSPAVVTSDVTIDGGSCTINGITITGSVSVVNGGSLTTSGAVTINGGIMATGSGALNLGGTLVVSGGVSMAETTATVNLGPQADVTGLSISGGANAIVRGKTGSVGAKEAGSVFINGGTVIGGGVLIELGTADLRICGANITGGVNVIETSGDVQIAPGNSCTATNIIGSISVEKGVGNIVLGGGLFQAADFNVVEVQGEIRVSDTTFSDIKIEKSTGDVLFERIVADSDGSLIQIDGVITLRDSTVTGDFSINGALAATISGSNFASESFSVSAVTGAVSVIGNEDFSVSLIENSGPVWFSNNNAQVVSLGSNTGGVTISGNTIASISCSDNSPPPSGSGNTVTGVSDGQCASL